MIVKVKDVNIFINKNILQKSKAVNKEESIIIEIIIIETRRQKLQINFDFMRRIQDNLV